MNRKFPLAVVVLALGFVSFAMPQNSFAAGVQSPWPGQPGNAVGHTASPTWTGSFNATPCNSSPASGTSWANASVTQNCTMPAGDQHITCNYCMFINVDWPGTTGAGNHWMAGNHMLFIGNRFQSNYVTAGNVGVTGSDIYFFYDSVTPLTSFATTPPGTLWPSAGAGANSITITPGSNAIAYTSGYEYGFNIGVGAGPIWIDHCDIWGWAGGVIVQTTNTGVTVTSNYVHDARDAGGVDHDDAIGYTNGNTAPNNWWIIGNVFASLGNTSSLALQTATGGYQNTQVTNNFFSGQTGGTIAFCQPGSVQCTNSTLYGNTLGTDIASGGALYNGGAALGTGSVWACNTIGFRAGTTWTGLDGWTPTSGMNGQYLINAVSNYVSAMDQGSNTRCGIPSPAALNFGQQGVNATSAGKTITFSSTNTGNLSISSIALVSGTQFSITSNTCASTLNSGSSCSITVAFSPTAAGPQTDTLRITDNSPGASSPHLVPLLGVGTPSSNAGVAAPTGLTAQVQ